MTTTPLPEPRRFIARPAEITQGYKGGSVTGLDVGSMAEEILGPVDWCSATTYMMRRFGHPNKPCDPDVEIAGWLITTPMRDVHLSFRSAPGSTSTIFSWVGMGTMHDGILACARTRGDRWRRDFGEWCMRTIGVERPPSHAFDEAMTRFSAEVPRVEEDDLLLHAREAIARTLHDLRRTVSIRDTDIDVRGETERRVGHVQKAPTSGAYVPPIAYDKEMWGIYGAIHRLGGGRRGLQALLATMGPEA